MATPHPTRAIADKPTALRTAPAAQRIPPPPSGDEPLGAVSPNNVHETGVSAGGQLGIPRVAAEPSKSSELRRQLVQDLMGTVSRSPATRRPSRRLYGLARERGETVGSLALVQPRERHRNSDHAATCPFTNRSSCRCRTIHAARSSARRPHSTLGGLGSQVLKFLDWLALVADRCGISWRFRG